MPDLSKVKVTSPIYDFKEPITSRSGSTIGSADTALGRFGLGFGFHTYYDKSFAGYDNQQNDRYANQNYLNAVGNFAADLGVKTLSGIPGLVGSVVGVGQGLGSVATGGSFMEGFNDNPILNFAETMNHWGDEHFPHMLEEGFQDRTFLEQLNPAKSGGQILTSNVSTLGFLAQSFGIAGLIGKIGLGARIAPTLSKVKNFKEALTTLEAPNLARIASNIDDVALNAFLTTNEAAMEGLEAKKTAVDKLKQDRLEGKNNFTDDQIEELSNSTQNNVFFSNMITLGATNYAFGKLVKPLFSPSAVSTRANKWALEKATTGKDFVQGSTKNMSKFDRFLFDEGHATGMATKALAAQVLSEGPEESLQLSVQRVNEIEEGRKGFMNAFGDAMKDFALHGFDLDDPERGKAFGLGALIGAGSTGVMHFTKYGAYQQAKDLRATREAMIGDLNKTFTDFDSTSLVAKDPDQKGRLYSKKDEATGEERFFIEQDDKIAELSPNTYSQYKEQFETDADGNFVIPGKIQLDENGAPIKDFQKMADLAATVKYHTALDNLIDIEASRGKPDELKISMYKKQKIKDLADKAFRSGTTGILMERLDEYKSLTDERLAEAGYESREQLNTEIDSLKDYVTRLEKNYLSTTNGIVAPQTVDSSQDHIQFRNEAARLGMDIVTIDALIQEVNEKLTTLNVENSEIAERLNEIARTFRGTEIESLFPYTTEMSTEPQQREAAQLVEKKKELIRVRESLGESYTKYLDPKQGFKAWKKDRTALMHKLNLRTKFFLNDKATDKDLDDFIKGEMTFEATKEADRRATSVFYADAINKFIKFLVPEGFTADAAASLTKLVQDVVDKEVQLYPDEAEKLKNYVREMHAEYMRSIDAINKAAADMGTDIESLEYVDPDELSQELVDLLSDYDNLQEVYQKLSPIIKDPQSTYDKIDDLAGMEFGLATEEELLSRVMDKLLNPFTKIIKASNFNGDSISSDFVDISRVVQAKQALAPLVKLLKAKSKKDDQYSSYVKKAKKLLDDLNQIEKLTKANISNRELKEQQENELYASAFESIIDMFPFAKDGYNTVKKISKTLAAVATPHLIKANVKDPQLVFDTIKSDAIDAINGAGIYDDARRVDPEGKKRSLFQILSEDEKKAAIQQPSKAFGGIWKNILDNEKLIPTTDRNLAPLEDFIKTYDVLTFSRNLDQFVGITSAEELRGLLDTQLRLLAVQQTEAVINSAFSDVDYIDKLIKTLTEDKSGIVPSQGQLRVLRELSIFFNSSFNTRNEMWDNTAALKAPAGAGKSLIISRYFKALNFLKDNEIFTAAPHKLAADNIAKSVNSTHGANTVKDLTEALAKDAIPKQVRLILLDEAGALDIETLTKLGAELAKFNARNPDSVVRMVMLYDPNQISAGNHGKATLDFKSYYEVSSVESAYWNGNNVEKRAYKTGNKVSSDYSNIPFVQNIQQITPLSTTYRSDVVEIADLQNTFKTDKIVNNVDSSASSNPVVNMTGIQGTYAEKGSNIVEAFLRSQKQNPERSRSVIVGSSQKKDNYLKQLPGAEVLTVEEAQGITRDEVYVDLEAGDASVFDSNPTTFNQFMYTALSRAVKYIHMANAPSPTFFEDKTLDARVEEIKSQKENVKEARLETLNNEKQALKDLLGEEEKVELEKPAEKSLPKDEVEDTEEVEEDEPQDVPVDVVPPEELPQNFHSLRRPNSKVFDQDPLFEPLVPGTAVKLVKDISNDKVRYLLLQQSVPTELGAGHRIVAVLEDSEVDEFKSTTGVDPKTLTGSVYGQDRAFGFEGIKSVDGSMEKIDMYVGQSSGDLQYVYQYEPTVSFADYVDEEGVLNSLPILERHLQTMFGPDPRAHLEDYDDVITNFKNYTRIVSYSSDKQILRDFAQGRDMKDLDKTKLPKVTVPYLLIENIKLKNSTKPLAKQFIRLQTEVINTNDAYMSPMFSFLTKLETFEDMLSRSNLPGKYAALKNGTGIQTDALNIYYPFHSFIAKLSDAYRASVRGEKFTVHMSNAENLQVMFPDLETSAIPADLLKLAYEIDVLVHGDLEEGEERRYAGEAQSLMDSIGAQNLVVSTAKGTNVLLRDYRTVGYNERGEATEAAGFSLLGPIRWQFGKGRSYNPTIKDKLKNRLSSYLKRIEAKGLGDTPRAKFIRGVVNTTVSDHLKPVTTSTIRELFVDSADSNGRLTNVSNGFGLRRPLKKDINVKINRNNLEYNPIDQVDASYFTSTFDKVIPTRITVSASRDASESTPALDVPTKAEDSPIIRLKKDIESGANITADEETKASFASMMDAVNFDEAVEKYLDRVKERTTYSFDTKTIAGAVRDFYQDKPGKSLKELIVNELQSSLNIVGIGKGKNTTAARDFIRTTILARLFPSISYAQSRTLSDVARDYYNLNDPKDVASFEAVIEKFAYETGQSTVDVAQALNTLSRTYFNILEEETGITQDKILSKMDELYPGVPEHSFLTMVQTLVIASSMYREEIRSRQTPALGLEGYEEFIRSVVEAGDNPDLYTDIVNDPANAEFMQRLGATEEDAFDKASDVLANQERSFIYEEGQDVGDLMTDSEVSDLLDRLYPAKYTRFIDKLLSKGSGEQKRFAIFNLLQNSRGQKVWGLYKNGLMSFVRHASGKVGKKVVLHEFFHKVFWEFLTHGERTHLFALAQEKWGNLSLESLEEKLADDFMEYAPKPLPNIFMRFWELLKRLLGFSRAYLPSIEDYFQGIYQRKFAPTGEAVEVERSMMNILSKYESLDQYFLAKKIIMDTYQSILDNRKADKVLSLQEAGAKVFEELARLREKPELITTNEVQAAEVKEAVSRTLEKRTLLSWQSFLFPQTPLSEAIKNLKEEERLKIEALAKEVNAKREEISALDASVSEDELSRLTDELEGLEGELEEANLNAELFDSELRDPKVKLTGAVKQRLLSIQYHKNGKRTFGELDRTYAILLGKLSSLPTTSLTIAVDDILKVFHRYRGNFEKPTLEQATGKFMYQTAARLDDQLRNTRKDVSFRKDASIKGYYAIFSRDGASTHGVTRYEAERNPMQYTLVEQEPGTTTDNFINRIASYSSIPKTEVAKAFFFFEDLDFMKSLLSAVASLQQSNPHVALQWWDYGKYRTTFYQVKMSGGVTAFQGRFTSKFSDYAASRTGDDLFDIDLLSEIRNAKRSGKREDQIKAIANFLGTIGTKFTTRELQSAQDEDIRNLSNLLPEALDSIQAQFARSVDSFDSPEEWRKNRNGASLLAEEFALVGAVAVVVNSHYGMTDNNSYTRGDGKKAFGYRDESYQSSIFTAIKRAANGISHRVYSTFNIKGTSLSSTDRFLKDNLFMNGKNQIFDFIDFDSKKTRGNSRFAKYLRKENLSDFRERHISFGFLTRLRQSKRGSYYQFMPIPSNRTSIQAVEVKAFKADQIDEALKQIIKAQKNRPDPKSNPDLASNKTYNAMIEVTYKDADDNTQTKKVPNYKVWKLAGLEGSVDDMTEAQALAAVKKHVKDKVAEMLPDMLYKEFNKKGSVNFSSLDLNHAAKFFGIGTSVDDKVSSRSEDKDKAAVLQAKNKIIAEILPYFYYNFIINQYSLSQIVYGDESFYKSKEDETKRIQVVTATGDTLLADDVYGLPKRTKILVIKDVSRQVPDDLEDVLSSSFRDAYDSTDAEGFILPEYYERIAATYGTESMTDVVLKPVYFAIENGVPTAVKYSVKVLTDDFVKAYPHLEKLREAMRAQGAHQAVFSSAVKVGLPKQVATMSDAGVIETTSITPESILDVDSNMLRFQLNPAKSPEVTTRNPSQITAFVNTNGQNQKEIADLHRLNARIIENKRREIAREFMLTEKGGISGKSMRAFRNKIKDATEGLAGALDLHRLVSFKGANKEQVSLDLPLIADRAVASISSMISDATVGFRFAGSKLVLQADIGKHNIFGEKEPRELKWKDEDGFTEVILPETYAPFVKVGEKFIPGNQNGLIGFRIPSTNYHSAIAMKVAGFYPVPKGAKGNIIIAPSLIVYYHGSDNDVDTLFVMRKQTWEKESIDLNTILSKYDSNHVSSESLNLTKGQTIIGFNKEARALVGKQPIEDYLQRVIVKLDQSLRKATEELTVPGLTKIKEKELQEYITSINTDFKILVDVVDHAAKNAIVDLISTNMQDRKNRKDLLTPISFARVASIKAKTQKELNELLESEEFLQELADAGLIEFKCESV